MKISKNKAVKACGEILPEPIEAPADDQDVLDELGVVDSPRTIAVRHVRSAIDELAKIASEDEVAHNCIADLSVVLFSLQ